MTNKKCTAISIKAAITVPEQRAAEKTKGHKIALLEKKLVELDQFENNTKNRMQDRMKFMSGKNARLKNAELEKLTREQDLIRAQIKGLQEI